MSTVFWHNLRKLHRGARSLATSRQGAAGIEFAIIFPILMLIVAGAVDLSQAILASRKTTQIASSLAGFVADQNEWTTAQVDDLITASSFIMQPLPQKDLKIVLSVLAISADGKAKVTASRALGTSALSVGSDSPIEVPSAILDSKVNLILTQIDYSLVTPFSTLWPMPVVRDQFKFKKYYFSRPRRSDKVVIQ